MIIQLDKCYKLCIMDNCIYREVNYFLIAGQCWILDLNKMRFDRVEISTYLYYLELYVLFVWLFVFSMMRPMSFQEVELSLRDINM